MAGVRGDAMVLAEALVAIRADQSLLQDELKAIRGKLETTFSDVSNSIRLAITGIVGGAIAMTGRKFLTMAGDVERSAVKFETLLGDVDDAADAVGRLDGQRADVDVRAPGAGSLASAVDGARQSIAKMSATPVRITGAERAKALIQEISQFAAETPFEMPELEKAVQAQLIYGASAREAMADVRMLGDIAATSGTNLVELAELYGRLKAGGPHQTIGMDAIGMLTSRGIMTKKDIAEQLGVSMRKLDKILSDGGVKWRHIEPLFMRLTQSGGRFYKGMEKQAATFHGLASTLSDSLGLIGAGIGQLFLSSANSMMRAGIMVADMVRQWVARVVERNNATGGMVTRTTAAVAAAAAIVVLAPKVYTAFLVMSRGVRALMAGSGVGLLVVGLTTVILLVWEFWDSLHAVLQASGWLESLAISFRKLWAMMGAQFSRFVGSIQQAVKPVVDVARKMIADVSQWLGMNFGVIADNVRLAFQAAVAMAVAGLRQVVQYVAMGLRVVAAALSLWERATGMAFGRIVYAVLRFVREVMEWFVVLVENSDDAMKLVYKAIAFRLSQVADALRELAMEFFGFFNRVTRMGVVFGAAMKDVLTKAFTKGVVAIGAEGLSTITRQLREAATAAIDEIPEFQSDRTKALGREVAELNNRLKTAKKNLESLRTGDLNANEAAPADNGGNRNSDRSMPDTKLGFVGFEEASKEMQRSILDKPDKQLGVLIGIQDVNKDMLKEMKAANKAPPPAPQPAILG